MMNFELIKTCFKHWLKYGQYAYDPNEYIALHDRQLLVQIISKVACTSIKATIGKSIGIDHKLPSGLDIHRNPKWHVLYGDQIRAYSHYDLICFVRNPLARLVSCYKQRVLFYEDDPDFPEYYFKDHPYTIKANCPFSEFLNKVIRIPDHAADRHFKSQYASIFGKKTRTPEFIGRLENIEEDWKKVANRYDLQERLLKLNSGHVDKQLPDKWQEFYTDEDMEKAREKFRNDLEMFGYE